jgi:hypothetical protein
LLEEKFKNANDFDYPSIIDYRMSTSLNTTEVELGPHIYDTMNDLVFKNTLN